MPYYQPLEINEEVDVISYYNHVTKKFRPLRIRWKGRIYKNLKEVSHPMTLDMKGDATIIFNVTSGETQFILHFNTKTAHWTLKTVSEGL